MTPIPVHPEGPRYVRSLLFVPGLWMLPEALRALASFLAHRGWAGLIADAGGAGGVAARAAEVAALARSLDAPPVVVGYDAGGLIGLGAAYEAPVAAVAWLAPIRPRPKELTRLLGAWRVAGALLRSRDLPAPAGAAREVLFGSAAPPARATESIALVRDVLRARVVSPPAELPVVVLAARGDRLAAGAAPPGAEVIELAVPGRSLIGPAAWQTTADALHRWLVRRLGVENLELYEEAMAERELPEDE
jgi:hypothetical protein